MESSALTDPFIPPFDPALHAISLSITTYLEKILMEQSVHQLAEIARLMDAISSINTQVEQSVRQSAEIALALDANSSTTTRAITEATSRNQKGHDNSYYRLLHVVEELAITDFYNKVGISSQ